MNGLQYILLVYCNPMLMWRRKTVRPSRVFLWLGRYLPPRCLSISLNAHQTLHVLTNQESDCSTCSTKKQCFYSTQEPVTGAAHSRETIASATDNVRVNALTFCNVPEKALETSQEKEHYSCHEASRSKELV